MMQLEKNICRETESGSFTSTQAQLTLHSWFEWAYIKSLIARYALPRTSRIEFELSLSACSEYDAYNLGLILAPGYD